MLAYSDIAPNTRFFFRPSVVGMTEDEAVVFKGPELAPERKLEITASIEIVCRFFCSVPPAGTA